MCLVPMFDQHQFGVMRFAVIGSVLLLVVLFGCTALNPPEDPVKSIPQVQEFLLAHPAASVNISAYSKETFIADQNIWSSHCDQNIVPADFLAGSVSDSNRSLMVLLDLNYSPLCVYEKDSNQSFKPILPLDLNSLLDLNLDNPNPDLNGLDVNDLNPDQNTNMDVNCDNPWKCGLWTVCDQNKQTRTCSVKTGCTQSTPKPSEQLSCVDEPVLKNCYDSNGSVCADNQQCVGSHINAKDTTLCCSQCRIKTCAGFNGVSCGTSYTCSTTKFSSFDSNYCCTGTCTLTDPCAGITCADANKTCVAGTCVLKTCAQQSGTVCSGSTVCSIATVDANDSAVCCTGACQNPTCGQRGGQICGSTQGCIADLLPQSGIQYTPDLNGWYSASDSPYCCDTTRTEVYGCATGDLSIAGPATWGPGTFGNELRIAGFSVDYGFSDTNKLGVTMMPVKFYIDSVLDSNYSQALVHANGVLTNFSNVADTGTHIIYYATDMNLEGKTIRIEIDSDYDFIETNENNNAFEGTVTYHSS